MLTGAASNATFGAVNRYANHKILELGGYSEMAQQQKAWDGTQTLVDAALGAAFGAIHHFRSAAEQRAQAALRSPDMQDAALTANLALKDRQSAPGVPVDPEASAAHQAALEKAAGDLLQGKPVDVSDTGVDKAGFLARPSFEDPVAAKVMVDSFKESGLLDEEANLRDLDAAFAKMTELRSATSQPRLEAAPEGGAPAAAGTTFTTAKGSTYEVTDKGTTIRNKAARTDPGHEGDSGPQPESERTFYVSAEDAQKLGEFQTQGGPKKAIAFTQDGRAGVKYLEGDSEGKFERRTVVSTHDEPAQGLTPVELWKDGTRAHFGNEITEVNKPAADDTTGPTGAQGQGEATAQLNKTADPIAQALAERPSLQIPDEAGKPIEATQALAQADGAVKQSASDLPTAITAAIDCFSRRGS
jgi:hypothetical protein